MIRIIALALAAVLLAGCNTTSVLQGGSSITAPIDNPVGNRELAAAYASYGVALSLAVNYRRLGLCAKDQGATLAKPCAKRSVVVALQKADRKAAASLDIARSFVRDNPQLSAVTLIAAARKAVDDFRQVLVDNGVQ